jgi:uncharacterized coiled-coil protein SlyX
MTDDNPAEDQRSVASDFNEFQDEIERLHAEIARLRSQNSDLLQNIIDRDYERPPHYR